MRGRLSVIAERDGHFAFFQGAPGSEPDPQRADQNFTPADEPMEQEDYLKQAQGVLDESRARNDTLWYSNTNRRQLGVEVERARK